MTARTGAGAAGALALLLVGAFGVAAAEPKARFALTPVPAADVGQLVEAAPPASGAEKRFTDQRGWTILLAPANAEVRESTLDGAKLVWSVADREQSCAIDALPVTMVEGAYAGFDFDQASLKGMFLPHNETAIVLPNVKVRERRLLTLGSPGPNGQPPQAAGWRYEAVGGLETGMALVGGPKGQAMIHCFRRDGGDPLEIIAARWRIAEPFVR